MWRYSHLVVLPAVFFNARLGEGAVRECRLPQVLDLHGEVLHAQREEVVRVRALACACRFCQMRSRSLRLSLM